MFETIHFRCTSLAILLYRLSGMTNLKSDKVYQKRDDIQNCNSKIFLTPYLFII